MFLFVALDSTAHRFRELERGTLHETLIQGLTEDEREYMGHLADHTYKLAQATRKFSWSLKNG